MSETVRTPVEEEKHRVRVVLAGRVLTAKMGVLGAEEAAKLFALVPTNVPARGLVVARARYAEAVETYRAVFGIAPPEADGTLHALAIHVEREWKPGMSEAILRLAEKIIAAHKEPKP